MCQNGSGLKFSIQTPAAPLVLEDEYVPTVRTYVRTYMTCKMLAAHVCMWAMRSMLENVLSV